VYVHQLGFFERVAKVHSNNGRPKAAIAVKTIENYCPQEAFFSPGTSMSLASLKVTDSSMEPCA
jgi:hypothetical protein